MIEVKGNLILNLPKLNQYPIPFLQETDIKEYINQFSNEPIKNPLLIDDVIGNDLLPI